MYILVFLIATIAVTLLAPTAVEERERRGEEKVVAPVSS